MTRDSFSAAADIRDYVSAHSKGDGLLILMPGDENPILMCFLEYG
jgi:hypothetical protein